MPKPPRLGLDPPRGSLRARVCAAAAVLPALAVEPLRLRTGALRQRRRLAQKSQTYLDGVLVPALIDD
jgi:hypothetical protein